ncbi:MAG: ACP S-malonyltransferase [Bacteroidales bacterium]|nr:ACP S-malonyltransferase [Bacteroidales bacterium]
MKNSFIFPGQGCQKEGMGKELYENYSAAQEIFEEANEFLGRRISDIMFDGSEEELMETINTQPAVFVYEVALAKTQSEILPDVVAGHSLGEFAALVVNGTISFKDGLNLVLNRALISQEVCSNFETAMAAVIGLEDDYIKRRVHEIFNESGEPIYFANYNGPGQVVITGSKKGIRLACKSFRKEGAKKAVPLPIGGSFHSPYMKEAELELGKIINSIEFKKPVCPIYQCVDAEVHSDPIEIKNNLIIHITNSVQWTSMVRNMVRDGVSEFYEVGTDDTLQKMVARMYPDKNVLSLLDIPFYNNIKSFKGD